MFDRKSSDDACGKGLKQAEGTSGRNRRTIRSLPGSGTAAAEMRRQTFQTSRYVDGIPNAGGEVFVVGES